MKNPKVSVIVPVYNVSMFIEACLNSLVNQTLKSIEIIVVDDCGNDDSMIKVNKIAKNHLNVKIITHSVNQGLSEARNTGIKHCKGEYISFLDSDDFVDIHFFEELYNNAIKEDADIVCGNIYYYKNGNCYSDWVDYYNFKQGKKCVATPEDKQYNIYACAVWGKIYKKTLFTKHNLQFTKNIYYEDVPITFITTLLANKIILVNNVYLYYVQRTDSIMAVSNNSLKPFDIFKVYKVCDTYMEYVKHSFPKNYLVYKQILDNFKIFNTYNWYNGMQGEKNRQKFFFVMKDLFRSIDIKDNNFIQQQSLLTYKKVLGGIIYKIKIKLFGISVLKIKKYYSNKAKYYLLGIKILTVYTK